VSRAGGRVVCDEAGSRCARAEEEEEEEEEGGRREDKRSREVSGARRLRERGTTALRERRRGREWRARRTERAMGARKRRKKKRRKKKRRIPKTREKGEAKRLRDAGLPAPRRMGTRARRVSRSDQEPCVAGGRRAVVSCLPVRMCECMLGRVRTRYNTA